VRQTLRSTLHGLLLACALSASAAQAKTVGDVDIPPTLALGEAELQLNGAGIRTRFFVDVYVASLYLTRRSADAEAIVAADEPMAIRLAVTSSFVTNERLRDSIESGFERATHGNTGPLRPSIEALMQVYAEKVSQGDVFELGWVPGSGLEVTKNGVHAATVDGGLAFKRAFFAIWLGEPPAQASLKRDLLGE